MLRFALALTALITVALSAEPAFAKRCDGDFEYVRGSWVATRYCRANQIASIARELGMRVTTESILANPGKAAEVCRFVDTDMRAQPACVQIQSRFQLSF